MSRIARDLYRRKLKRYLSISLDEHLITLISAVAEVQSGNSNAFCSTLDLPPGLLGAKLGSAYNIPPWSLETLVNELLVTRKRKIRGVPNERSLDTKRYDTIRTLHGILDKLENSEDGIFLEKYDVLYEMARIAQRQFHLQRGVFNAPHLYRSLLLYRTDTAREFFEAGAGIALPDFVKMGVHLLSSFRNSSLVYRDLPGSDITPNIREAALAKFAIPHAEARVQAARIRAARRHTAYSPSILRDFPIIAFGDGGERLRAPLPELIMYRCTSGLYLDVVKAGSAVWTGIGKRFEAYVLEYLQAMMLPYDVFGEEEYGAKKTRYRTPDVLVSRNGTLVAAVECKAKRMSFDARYADDPVLAASLGFEELAKGVFQIWRFFAHARRGLTGNLRVAPDCQGIIVTADSWLMMAKNQAEKVVAHAHALADKVSGIEPSDRREIAFCQIDDVEISLQRGTPDSFMTACRKVASGDKKGFMLSVAHTAGSHVIREYPFKERILELLPWMGCR